MVSEVQVAKPDSTSTEGHTKSGRKGSKPPRKRMTETISKRVDPIPLLSTVDTRKSMETVACTSSTSAQIFSSISDSDVP